MKHFVYAMNGSKPAPASGGLTKDWFFHYKWDVGGEAFVPVPDSIVGEAPAAGDLIWFFMDTHPLGYAVVSRTQEDPSNGFLEVYYDTQEIQAGSTDDTTYSCPYVTGTATGDVSSFLDSLKRHFDTYPKRGDATPPPFTAAEDTTA